jgi:hypothetical protein
MEHGGVQKEKKYGVEKQGTGTRKDVRSGTIEEVILFCLRQSISEGAASPSGWNISAHGFVS